MLGRVCRQVGRTGAGLGAGFHTVPPAQAQIGVWGACSDRGQPHPGTQFAPDAMRAAGLLAPLAATHQVTDHGDLVADCGVERQVGVARFGRAVAERVGAVLGAGQLCVTLGGDHSVALGTLAASLAHDPDCCVLWVDAHADINTVSGSSSGNMHGMPVSFNIPALVEQFPHPAELDWLVPRLDPARLAYIGLRDVEPREKESLARLGITAFFMSDVDRLGLARVTEAALASVDPAACRNIHLRNTIITYWQNQLHNIVALQVATK